MRRIRTLQYALHNPSDSDDPQERVDINLRNILALLDHAAGHDPDLVVFPEAALQHAASDMVEDVAQPVPGPATDAVAEKAVALDSYVVLPMYEQADGRYYNSAALIDPSGEVLGTFRKLVPTIREMDCGISPGSEVPVWDTDLGRVGMFICWDSRYPEIGTELGAKGVELAVHPTHGSSHEAYRVWAKYNGFHVALCDKNDAKMYTPTGAVLGQNEAGWKAPRVEDVDLEDAEAVLSFTEVNTDMRSYSRGSSTAWDWPNDIREAYPGSIVLHNSFEDAVSIVECVDENLTLDDLEAEFEMETTRDYEDRTRERAIAEAEDSPLYRLEE